MVKKFTTNQFYKAAGEMLETFRLECEQDGHKITIQALCEATHIGIHTYYHLCAGECSNSDLYLVLFDYFQRFWADDPEKTNHLWAVYGEVVRKGAACAHYEGLQ
ncbi:MAG: hypothetical protein LBM62_10345 [Mediterranea sp.]|jgi:hypothetical protein|nr:hypothetical protein [Mediterranea sp.]